MFGGLSGGATVGFTIYYRSTRRLSPAKTNAIRGATDELCAGRTWLSCEPVGFFQDQRDGRLFGGSKPNFQPHPDHIAAAAREALPDGTVRDLIEILCRLSREYEVDWEFSHDHDPGPIGFIWGGVCEPRLREQLEGIGDLGGILQELMDEFEPHSRRFASSSRAAEHESDEDDDGDGAGPSVLPFRPKG
jgi:hypothetical protein